MEDSTFESVEFDEFDLGRPMQALNSTRPVEFNIWVDPNEIRRIQLIQTSNLPCVESNDLIRRMEDSTSELACLAGGIVRVRGKILTVQTKYGRRSREENGKKPESRGLPRELAAPPLLPRLGLDNIPRDNIPPATQATSKLGLSFLFFFSGQVQFLVK